MKVAGVTEGSPLAASTVARCIGRYNHLAPGQDDRLARPLASRRATIASPRTLASLDALNLDTLHELAAVASSDGAAKGAIVSILSCRLKS